MEISNVVTILLFILPGVLAMKVIQMLGFPSENEPSDFLKTVNGIMVSLPILFINILLFTLAKEVETVEEFRRLFDNLTFVGSFIFSITLTSVILGYLSSRTKRPRLKLLNIIRKYLGKMESNKGSCWQKFSIERNESRFFEVIINGQSSKGFAGDYSAANETMSLILETDSSLYLYDDYDPEILFTKVIGTYIDIERNVVIKDYDMSEYYKWIESKEVEIKATSLDEEEALV